MVEPANSLFPDGLSGEELNELEECTTKAAELSVECLLGKAKDHVANTRCAFNQNPLLDINLAEALYGVIEAIVASWRTVPNFARPWCKGMILYFASCNKDENDHDSPIGFDDDAEVINACLRMAGRDDLCINLEEFDDAFNG